MKNRILTFVLMMIGVISSPNLIRAQAYNGYTLFSPNTSRYTYLVNMSNTVIHSWTHTKGGGYSCYLLEDGSLLRPALSTNSSLGGGGEAGVVQKVAWDGTLLWEYTYSSSTVRTHHDIEPMPNGNVLLIAWEVKTASQTVAAGLNHSSSLRVDHIIEVQPVGSTGGNIVWQWHAWDHLIQDYSSSKSNYGVVADHPELLDINLGGTGSDDLMHTNAISYNPTLDQIVISSHTLDEIYVIDHSTTTAEAATHAGGNSGKGGDILYRWGKPANYDASGSQYFDVVHCAVWIPDSLPGGGNIMAFNNRETQSTSIVVELVPPVDTTGKYTLVAGAAYGPSAPKWTYTASGFFSNHLGGCQRLPNNNTLIVESTSGNMFEVDSSGNVEWSYAPGGEIVRALRYAPTYSGLQALFPASCQLSSDTLLFGNVELSSSKIDSVTIKNTGTGSLVISSITSNNSSVFGVSETSTMTIGAGDSTRIHITFQPSSDGSHQGQIILVHNGSTSPDTVYANGIGISSSIADLEFTPSSISFGTVEVLSNKVDSVMLTNTGTATLTISTIESNNSSVFNVTESGPLMIGAGDSTQIHITFQPASSGEQEARITIAHDGISALDTIHVAGIGHQENQFDLSINSGWNMLSVPVTVPDYQKTTLFPTAISDAFSFTNAYVAEELLDNKKGYWLKFGSAGTVYMVGDKRLEDSIAVETGWNLIGSISTSVATSAIEMMPSDMTLSSYFGYAGSYANADTIRPGAAYWVKADKSGVLILKPSLSKTSKIDPFPDALQYIRQNFSSLTILDRNGHKQTLYFGIDNDTPIPVERFVLPPRPPENVFDARFETSNGGSTVRTYSSNPQQVIQYPVIIQSDAYPLTIEWRIAPEVSSCRIIATTDDLSSVTTTLSGEGSTTIDENSQGRFVLSLGTGDFSPVEFTLSQNYPNPFNPSTSISFSVACDGYTSLKVYDVLGSEVATLFKGTAKSSVIYSINFDGTNFPSGVYFYRLSAGNFIAVKKLLLMK
jgi:hypothetical protein